MRTRDPGQGLVVAVGGGTGVPRPSGFLAARAGDYRAQAVGLPTAPGGPVEGVGVTISAASWVACASRVRPVNPTPPRPPRRARSVKRSRIFSPRWPEKRARALSSAAVGRHVALFVGAAVTSPASSRGRDAQRFQAHKRQRPRRWICEALLTAHPFVLRKEVDLARQS